MLLDLYFHHEQGNASSGVRRTPGAYQLQEQFLDLLNKKAEEEKPTPAAPIFKTVETFAEEKTFRETEARPVLARKRIPAPHAPTVETVQPLVVTELLLELDLLFGSMEVLPVPAVVVNLNQRMQRNRRRAAALLLMAA